MSFFSIFSKKVKKENLKEDKKISKIPDEQKNIPAGKVITIAREFGSGGREVALKVAEKLGYKFYDKEGIIEKLNNCIVFSYFFEFLLLFQQVFPFPLQFHLRLGPASGTDRTRLPKNQSEPVPLQQEPLFQNSLLLIQQHSSFMSFL